MTNYPTRDDIMRDCFTEALMTADEAGIKHGHAVILVMVDEDNPANRIRYTLDEVQTSLADIESRNPSLLL